MQENLFKNEYCHTVFYMLLIIRRKEVHYKTELNYVGTSWIEIIS